MGGKASLSRKGDKISKKTSMLEKKKPKQQKTLKYYNETIENILREIKMTQF